MPHGTVTAKTARTTVPIDHLHTLNVSRPDVIAEFPDEFDTRNALPLHVRGVEVESGNVAVASFAHRLQIVASRLDISHRALRRMALQPILRTVLPAGVENRREAFDEELETDLEHVRYIVTAEVRWDRWKEEPVRPAMRW